MSWKHATNSKTAPLNFKFWLRPCTQPQLLIVWDSSFDTFFITFFHVTLIKERKKRNPHLQLLTVWVQSHSHNYWLCETALSIPFSLPFSTWPWQKKEKWETHSHNCWLCERETHSHNCWLCECCGLEGLKLE